MKVLNVAVNCVKKVFKVALFLALATAIFVGWKMVSEYKTSIQLEHGMFEALMASNAETIEMYPGEAFSLPWDNVSAVSSDEAVAYVSSDGVVYAAGDGDAVISVKRNGFSNFPAKSYRVSVRAENEDAITVGKTKVTSSDFSAMFDQLHQMLPEWE